MRVQNIRDYVAWILKETPGWDRDHIDEAIRSGARIDAKLTAQVPVYWVYITAWATDGIVQFREDIYQKDGFGAGIASNASLPGASEPARAGKPQAASSQILEPMEDLQEN